MMVVSGVLGVVGVPMAVYGLAVDSTGDALLGLLLVVLAFLASCYRPTSRSRR